MTFKIWAQGVDETGTKGMVCVGSWIECSNDIKD